MLHFDIRHINTIKWEPTEQLARVMVLFPLRKHTVVYVAPQ
jgi:hypothetical protein